MPTDLAIPLQIIYKPPRTSPAPVAVRETLSGSPSPHGTPGLAHVPQLTLSPPASSAILLPSDTDVELPSTPPTPPEPARIPAAAKGKGKALSPPSNHGSRTKEAWDNDEPFGKHTSVGESDRESGIQAERASPAPSDVTIEIAILHANDLSGITWNRFVAFANIDALSNPQTCTTDVGLAFNGCSSYK
jgi:hypothetical protein